MTILRFEDEAIEELLEELTQIYHTECQYIKKDKTLTLNGRRPKDVFPEYYPSIDHFLKFVRVGCEYQKNSATPS